MALVLLTAGLLTQTNAVQVEVKSLAETATGEHLNLDQMVEAKSKVSLEQQAKLQEFEMLDQKTQNEILSQIAEGGQAEAQWGFLKNIINIDTFFSANGATKNSWKKHYEELERKHREEKAEAERKRQAKIQAEKDRIAKEKKAEEERIRKEKEKKRLAKEKAEKEEAERRAKKKAALEEEHRKLKALKEKVENERKALEEARKKAAEAARLAAEAEAKRKAEEAARKAAIAKAKAEAEAKAKAEAEAARLKAIADAKAKAEAEAKARAELLAKQKAEALAAKKRALEIARKKEEERLRKLAEAKAKAAAAAKKAAEEKAAAEKAAAEALARKKALEAAQKAKKEAAIKAAKLAAEKAERERLAAIARAKAQALAAKKAAERAERKRIAVQKAKERAFFISTRRNWHNNLVKISSGSKFHKRQLFYIVTFAKQTKVKGENQYSAFTRAFWAWNMKDAMNQFRSRTRSVAGRSNYEYALVAKSSGKVLVTTSAYWKTFDWKEAQKKGDVVETYNDWGSATLIGLMHRYNIAYVPTDWIKSQYTFVGLGKGKAEMVSLGTNWRAAWKKFSTDYRKKQVEGVLLRKDGRVYTWSGKRNNWGNYYGGLEALGRFSVMNKGNLVPGWTEKDSGLMLQTTWKEMMIKRSKYVDELKWEVTGNKFQTSGPFRVHYMWTGGRHAGRQGQLKYFRANNNKYAFDYFRSTSRRYLRANHDIVFTLTSGNYPNRQILVASEPMDSKNVQSMIGWMTRVRYLPLPAPTDEKKFFTLQTYHLDTKKTDTAYFSMDTSQRDVVKEFNKKYKAGKRRIAGIAVKGDRLIKFAYTNNRKGVDSRHHPSDVLLGQWAQSLKMHDSYKISDKQVGFVSQKEYASEQKQVNTYKSAQKKRMIAKAKEVISTRAKMLKKQRYIKLDKYYRFAIVMSYDNFKWQTRSSDKLIHVNQYIRYNRLDYVLKRYYDWIMYRTSWYMRYSNKREGLEHTLIGNNKVLWSTASGKDKAIQKQMSVAQAFQSNYFRLAKAQPNGVFVIGTLSGKFSAQACKSWKECRGLWSKQTRLGASSVPYFMIKGDRIVWKRTMRGVWADGSHSQYHMNYLIGQYIVSVQSEILDQGDEMNLKSAGITVQRFFKKSYTFFASHNAARGSTRNLRVWGYRTNNLMAAKKWYTQRGRWWNKQKAGAHALWIRVGNYPQLVAQSKGSYIDKAYNAGRMGYYFSNTLDKSCLGNFHKKSDLEISNMPAQKMFFKWYPGHSHKNYYAWKANVTKYKKNSVLVYPKGNNMRFWSVYTADRKNGGAGWREALGRFLMKYCPQKYVQAKGTYETLGLPF